ncbi:LacI family DNA-binding transcriptional regulator [Marinitoga aeolica]|uniref:LacI family DNA-binding transcriptional regulator n=1 Tax=Marinitoga aeolica TaxID=2809031 RepID=A0ABY8PPP6_9BACT|nr:LacI family DNA-binding transcriptional regulator [Marinitoga aeolica]WGS64609.1 LacI family DNA-binding transcriptional regulator [Marinitoga aeolica]
MATIKDVAKLAGVSISTASYALNGNEKISEATKKKVLEAAKKLKYKPNQFAKNLKQVKNDFIAVVLNEAFGPFYDNLIKGIQDSASLAGYDIIIFLESGLTKKTLINFFKQKIIKGTIIMSSTITNDEIDEISKEKIPIILLDRKCKNLNASSVLIDNEKGAYLATKHLIELNHKKIAFISGPKDSFDNNQRLKGYKKALKEFNIPYNHSLIIKGDFTEKSGYESVKKFINKTKEIPSAFFSSNDEMAIGALKAFEELNLKVPEDISLVGFDDIKELNYIEPKLTTIKRPMYELGSHSAHLLFNLIQGRSSNTNLLLDVNLIIRNSTARYKGDRK